MASGHKYTAPKWQIGRNVWEFQRSGISAHQVDALRAFWDAHNGPELAFNYTPPDADSVVAHFAPNGLKITEGRRGAFVVRLTIEELIV